ncbi:MAG: glycerol-3-phosphate 1-O-acyltransferase PlsY [Deltaproteobacteria bacterium]|nr:glycerol-3-phosphate 1-O-acyltransferase PlsY [Deltaproteobacteria bacterium]
MSISGLGLLAYLLGSVPFGLLIALIFKGLDPRLDGSRNVGATNIARLCGLRWGLLTLFCDLGKGFLPVLLSLHFFAAEAPFLCLLPGLACVLGHMFSLFLRFRGGKGVAACVGVFLAAAPAQLIAAGAICLVVIWRSGFVSAGSLTLVAVLPLLLLLTAAWPPFCLSLLIGALVAKAHRENIRRLLRGEEKPWLGKHSAKDVP